MKFNNFTKFFSKRETTENKIIPLTSEDWEGFFSGKETEIKVGNQIYNISLGLKENVFSDERMITLSNEYGLVIGQMNWDGESSISSGIGKDYGKKINILYAVSEYLNKEVPLQKNITKRQDGIKEVLNMRKE